MYNLKSDEQQKAFDLYNLRNSKHARILIPLEYAAPHQSRPTKARLSKKKKKGVQLSL